MNRNQLLLLFLFALLSLSFNAQIPNGPLRQLQSCEPGCLTCSSAEICTDCDINRVLTDGKCKCESPRVLIGTGCGCPWYMKESPTTENCEYIDLIDVAYHPEVSPLFDAILQAQINPRLKWTLPPTFTWTVECNYQNTATQTELNTYLSTQQSDFLRLPSTLLEHNLECNGKVSYNNQNSVEISKTFAFTTSSYFQPQVRIVGGPFQMFTHTNADSILAEVVSLTGSPIFPTDLKITWTQVSGKNKLDVTDFCSPSNPLRLTIPKCTFSQGKLYTFRIDVQVGLNPVVTSQEITIGIYAPNINLKPIETDTYHIYTTDLKLTATQFSVENECNQDIEPSDLLDLSTTKYTWECVIVDLHYSDRRRILSSESTEITEDANVIVHPDPQHLFYRSTTSKTLIIPSSYFAKYEGYQLIFYLTATIQSKTSSTPSITNFNLLQPTLQAIQTKAYVQILASKPFTTVNFSCMNKNNCQTFSEGFTQFVASNYNPKYTYTWIFHTFSAYETHDSYKNWLSIFTVDINPRIVPQIILQVTDGTNVASSFFTLPLYTPLVRGSISIYPSSGEAYKTNFFLSTYLSKEDDLPISFQFYSSSGGAVPNYLLKKYEPYDYSPILLPPDWGGCSFGVKMTDSFGYSMDVFKSVPLTGRCESLAEALERGYLAMDSSRSSSNLYQRLRLISVILENLQVWESYYPEEEAMNVTSSQFKYAAISELKDIFLALGPSDDIKENMLQNIQWASEQLFNEDRNWELYMNIMDTYFQTSSEKSVLTPGQHRKFAVILDNLIYYMKKPGSSFVDPEKVITYTNTLIRSTLSDLLPSNFAGFNYGNGNFFSLLTMKTTYCKVLGERIEVPYWYKISVNLTLKHETTLSPEECDKQADFIFMAFRPYYTVEGWGEFRTVLVFDMRDSITGESILDLYNYFLYSPMDFCPGLTGVCSPDDDGGTTIYGVFELKSQIYKIFGKSKIDQIVNISALSNFKFWQSVAFWTVIGFSIWFLISFYWLYIKHPTYCALNVNKTISQKPLYKKTNFFFWLVHPVIGIYLYNDPKTTKATRIALYFQRLAVVMLFSTIFSSISKGEGTVFRAYIILFNICTVIPINSLLNRIFGCTFKMKNSKKKFVSNLKRSSIILLYLLFLSACFIGIFIIEAQQDKSQNKQWAINFTISFLQDLTLSPFINFTIKILLIKLSLSKKTTKLNRTRKFITLLFSNFKSIYVLIFGITSTPYETQPPTPTEIVSPLSTSRKLLKLSTLDFASPTLPPSPAKRAFRTRRVSDTEMGNVDSVAAETLVTDRFQTIFSEGKTEQVKPLSPVKQNYERMQSANIASAKFANSGRLDSQDFNTNRERKFLNRTSIILSPSDPLPEQVEIELEDGLFSSDESPRGTQTSTSKLRKGKKGSGTALFSTQDKLETIREGRPFGTPVLSTLEKIKDEKALNSSLFSTQEKIKKPQSERCQTVI